MQTTTKPNFLSNLLNNSSGTDRYVFIVEQSIHHKEKVLSLVGKFLMIKAHSWYINEHLKFWYD